VYFVTSTEEEAMFLVLPVGIDDNLKSYEQGLTTFWQCVEQWRPRTNRSNFGHDPVYE